MSGLNFAHFQARHLETKQFSLGQTEHRSVALGSLFSNIKRDCKLSVLDFGAPTAQNVNFFSRYRCSLNFVDLPEQFLSLEKPQRNLDLLRSLLPEQEGRRFDTVFLWDILNYLSPQELQLVTSYLNERCNPRAQLHILLSTISNVPARPSKYRILTTDRVSCEVSSPSAISCQKYTYRDLARLIPNWKQFKAMQLSNSFQENLLIYEPKESSLINTALCRKEELELSF